jgi:hypothetical protein
MAVFLAGTPPSASQTSVCSTISDHEVERWLAVTSAQATRGRKTSSAPVE